jgi:hypothetical protein
MGTLAWPPPPARPRAASSHRRERSCSATSVPVPRAASGLNVAPLTSMKGWCIPSRCRRSGRYRFRARPRKRGQRDSRLEAVTIFILARVPTSTSSARRAASCRERIGLGTPARHAASGRPAASQPAAAGQGPRPGSSPASSEPTQSRRGSPPGPPGTAATATGAASSEGRNERTRAPAAIPAPLETERARSLASHRIPRGARAAQARSGTRHRPSVPASRAGERVAWKRPPSAAGKRFLSEFPSACRSRASNPRAAGSTPRSDCSASGTPGASHARQPALPQQQRGCARGGVREAHSRAMPASDPSPPPRWQRL